MNRVWTHSRQQGTKLVLLLAIADMANNNGYCWPSLETLQQRARLSHRQNVIKAIAEMEETAEVWVERSRGRNHSNSYIVTVGMNADELAQTLVTHFDYSPTEAINKSSAFLKCSPQTTLSKCSPQAQNVVEELHLNQENVVVGLTKCSPQTTRSVIEPLSNNITDSSSVTGSGKKQKSKESEDQDEKVTPDNQAWFGAICWLVHEHQDYTLLSKKERALIGKAIKAILSSDGKYTIDDLRRWYKEKWSVEWPGKQKNTNKIQAPTLEQIKTGIGWTRQAVKQNEFAQDVPVVAPKSVPTYKRVKALN